MLTLHVSPRATCWPPTTRNRCPRAQAATARVATDQPVAPTRSRLGTRSLGAAAELEVLRRWACRVAATRKRARAGRGHPRRLAAARVAQCPAVIVINPPGSLGPVPAARLAGDGLPLDSLRAIDRGHPLLYGVATGRVGLTQTAVLEAAGRSKRSGAARKDPCSSPARFARAAGRRHGLQPAEGPTTAAPGVVPAARGKRDQLDGPEPARRTPGHEPPHRRDGAAGTFRTFRLCSYHVQSHSA